jgi:copper resistance protein C
MHKSNGIGRSTVRTWPLLLLLLGAATANAHAKLLSAEPAAQSTAAAPTKIQLHFSEELARKFSSFKLADASGAAVLLHVAEGSDAKSLAAIPARTLAPGSYTVTWTAVANDDGHKSTGSYVFSVK